MSREIKFRAWDQVSKIFLDMSDACYYLLPFGKLVQITCNTRKPDTHIELNTVVQLYTGLKDWNGQEIYEGDILKYGSCVEVVFYEPTMGRFMTELKKCNDESEIGEISSLSPYYTDNYKVIGNIFENSELLK
ncbi:MAG: hypothetical protein IJ923_04485 [Campylobacter sp.]|nr:hypothetical protein [Campylobacter sp.]